MRRLALFGLALLVWSGVLLLFSPPAWAIPSFARRYGISCSACHRAWPVLNDEGLSFKMSGYRRLNGRELTPTTKDIELGAGAFAIPAIPPLAIVGTFGFDSQELQRRSSDGTKATRTGSSFNVNELELLVGVPLGQNLSFFLDYELFGTEFEKPAGPAEANETGSRRNITFESEGPGAPAMAKVIWNNLFGSLVPLDNVNLVAGVEELPLGISPDHRRLSVAPYLIYHRRALELLNNRGPLDDLLIKAQNDRLLRLDRAQVGVELRGFFMPGAAGPTDVGKPETLVIQYNLGITNGSNNQSDPNTGKDFSGRLAMRWWGQTLGLFGYWSPDIYSDDMRRPVPDGVAIDPANPDEGVLAGLGRHNAFSSVGPDLLLSLEPWDIPVWLETQVLFNRESNPTGFNKEFRWWGGFTQINWKIVDSLVAYGRYDWIRGNRFDDIGVGGVTPVVKPQEWGIVAGLQWYVLENLKLLGEYSRREFRNNLSTPATQKLNENFFSVRASLGF
jgi:hypothetical protein